MVLTEVQTHYSLQHSYLYLSILGITTCLTDCEDDTTGLGWPGSVCVYNKQLINCVKTFPIRLGSALSGVTFLSFLSSHNSCPTRTAENKMRPSLSHNLCIALHSLNCQPRPGGLQIGITGSRGKLEVSPRPLF